MSEFICTEIIRATMKITINRPESKNAINLSMYEALAKAIDSAVGDDAIRVILLSGIDGCFTSGNDLNDFVQLAELKNKNNPLLSFMYKLAACPKVVVAAVDGHAIGIGTTMLLHCDFVYANPKANFALPFVNLGLCPEYASSFLLPKMVGLRKANEYLLLGKNFDATEALKNGLINEIQAGVLQHALAVCDELAMQAPEALRQTKALIKSSLQLQLENVIDEEVAVFSALLEGAEFAEAAAAFFEKRQADFSNLK